MLKEIRYTCGTQTWHNTPVDPSVFEAFELGLAKAFGGFTRTEGYGGYIMSDGSLKTEQVHIYDVAVSTDLLIGMAKSLASQLCGMAEQETVYFRDIDGTVQFVEA